MKRQRPGYSLLEIMIAAAVLFGSSVVLTQLAGVGLRHLHKASDRTMAQTFCQNKMNELLSGITPMQPSDFSPLIGDPAWSFAVEIQPLDLANLVEVAVIVSPTDLLGDSARFEDPRRAYRLVRWMRHVIEPNMSTSEQPNAAREEFIQRS